MSKVDNWTLYPVGKTRAERDLEREPDIVIPLKKSYSLLPPTPYERHKARDPEAHGVGLGIAAIIIGFLVMLTVK